MKKKIGWALGGYIVYCIAIICYFFLFAHPSIPSEWKGTAADPATFLTPNEQLLSEQYSRWKNLLFFLSIPYDWLIYLFILWLGIGKTLQRWVERAAERFLLQAAIYAFWLSLLVTMWTLPVAWISYRISRAYGVSTQSLSSWLHDQTIDFLIQTVVFFLIALVLYSFIRRFEKRWWLYAWLVSVPLTIFFMFIQPVVIDPLYNDFYPLKDKALEGKILALAEKAHIPADHVFEVNMSEKTNALNAYVTGIGSHARIVLWDTTLTRLQEREILFIMAHEMGHYVMKHIYWGVAGTILLLFVGLFIANRVVKWAIRIWGNSFHLQKIHEFASFPLFLLVFSLLSFVASPTVNFVARQEEHAADEYAIQLTHDPAAAISAFQKLTEAGLSEVNPPTLVKLFRYTHPTIFERIVFLEQIKQKK
ncbi:Zn-dependent protease with chaperone function [Anoxybacillus voinovskiensis]|uniref:Zn-dependent protease with chaperone function n=1 Tax=Anoxybacteroides voinovskiense TaxID=230470 RepID=A0A840DSQ0_9BACL|nr:M48 family metallopeptidase [Anoxybacillus voinovskiensis]MBB4074582.1 Zn-dependent protease with chaperone function [Anoxybacillus voinovskiensis]GGJ72028.1 metalloprotease [Anoxybacillus voinovskiensis]